MGNVGKAVVTIGLSDSLNNVNKEPNYSSFDLSSDAIMQSAKSSDKTAPLNMEFAKLEGSLTAAFPAKGLHRINNYIDQDPQWDGPQSTAKVVWKPMDVVNATNIVSCYIDSTDQSMYTLMQPVQDYGTNTSYIGPRWWTRPDSVGAKVENDNPDQYSTSVEQYQSTPGLWWGLEASVDIGEGQTGIWVTVKLAGEKKKEKPSFLSMEFAGPPHFQVIIDEQGAYLIDYERKYEGGAQPTDPDEWNKFKLEGIDSISGAGQVQVGILPMLGYLAVWVNGTFNMYARISKENPTTYERFTVKISRIQMHGRNACVEIDASAMIFSKNGRIFPGLVDPPGGDPWEGSKVGPHSSVVGGGGGPWCLFPGQGGEVSAGACCKNYSDGGGSITCPSGSATDGMSGYTCPCSTAWGDIETSNVSDSEDPSILTLAILMKAEDIACFGGDPLPIGPPYLFRMRANKGEKGDSGGGGGAGITDVISLSESWDTPDYVHITHTVDVTLYNPAGRYNSLLSKSQGITVSAGLGGSTKTIFTGITLDASVSETAGRETITVHCNDYFEILEVTMLLNCPFYDGMLDINAAKDIAARAGLTVRVLAASGSGGTGYFLPAGYSFTEPKMRWGSDTTLKDGILNVLKLGEKICYFDTEGKLVIDDLQGGLAGGGGSASGGSFTKDPTTGNFNVILDEKRSDSLVGSAVDKVFVTSWDRVKGSPVIAQKESGSGVVPYGKTMYVDQPAFGSLDAVEDWINMITARVFKVPRRITFKTLQNDFSLLPLETITVDGVKYRVKGLNRRFDADSNSLTTEINGEWYGP